MAKASRKSTPVAASGKLAAGRARIAGKAAVHWNASAIFAGKGKLAADARKYRWVDITDRRPTSRGLVRQELERRYKDGEVPLGTMLKTIGFDLHNWLKNHPDNPPMMSAERIEKAVSDIWRDHQAAP